MGHPGQAGAQLSPGTGSSSAGRALALEGFCLHEPGMSHRSCHRLPGGSRAALWDLCKEVFVLGVFCP